jgi:hypothetical protein
MRRHAIQRASSRRLRSSTLFTNSTFARRLRVEQLEDRRVLAPFTVGNLDDLFVDSAGDAPGTLRQAIFDANNTPGFDTIEFEAGLTGMIGLSFGQFSITDSVELIGPGAGVITIDGQNATRLFDVNDFNGGGLLDVRITGLTLTGGNEGNGGGAIANQELLQVTNCLITGNAAQWGGGIYNGEYGDLTLSLCNITGNTATSSGGGVYNWGGTASVADCIIADNDSANEGGGVKNVNDGSFTITRSTISGNFANTSGGGLFNGDGTVNVTDSTLSGNEADYGGGVYVVTPSDDTTTISGSTISNNTANLGGAGVYNQNGRVVIEYSTITENNSNDFAGSGVVSQGGGFASTEVRSSIIAGNHHTDMAVVGFPNSFVSHGYNLVGVFGYDSELDVTDIVIGSADPLLGPLAFNGGPTLSHLPELGCPAIDAGDPLAEPGVGVPVLDQRGITRVIDGDSDSFPVIDVGAVESDLVYFIVDTLDNHSNGDFSAGDFTLREAIEQAELVAVGSGVIVFDPVLFSGGPATITLDFSQQLEIRASMAIDGPGLELLAIAVQNFGRAFLVDDLDNDNVSKVAIRGLTITGGNDPNGGGAIYNRERLEVANSLITGNTAQWGGGIYNDATGELTVVNSEISGNTATSTGGGGGIYNWGGLAFVFDSVISDNDSGTTGGGLLNANNGSLTISRTTVSGNDATTLGGGLFNGDGNILIVESTFSGNTANKGGGVYVLTPTDDTTTVTNSTISSNIAPLGGAGVFTNSGHTVIQFSTITANDSNDFAGSGVVTWGDPAFALTEIYSTIVAGNHHTDVAVTGGFVDTFESLGYNVIGTGSVDAFDDPGDWVIEMADPGLGPLADNGGPTMTHALLPGSPAIDQGDASLVAGSGNAPFFDQRGVGFERIRDGNGDSGSVIDVGAIELQEAPPADSADFDEDGDIDGRDFLAWQRGFGSAGAAKEDGDANNDGDVDGDDLGVWQDQYGSTPPLTAVVAVDEIALHIVPLVSDTPEVLELGWRDAVDAALAFSLSDRQDIDSHEPVPTEEFTVEALQPDVANHASAAEASSSSGVSAMKTSQASEDDPEADGIEEPLKLLGSALG